MLLGSNSLMGENAISPQSFNILCFTAEEANSTIKFQKVGDLCLLDLIR